MAEEGIKGNVCPTCGRGNPAGNRFCGFCGATLPVAPMAPPPSVQPAVPKPALETPVAPVPPITPVAPVSVAVNAEAEKVEPTAAEIAALLAGTAKLPKSAPLKTGPNPPPPAPSRPVVARRAPEPSSPPLPIPADPIQREREREKLLTQASAFRVKGLVTDARETLQQAVRFFEGRPPQEVAPIYEQIGDLLETEDFADEAMTAYGAAYELDPKRVSADRKKATLALNLATRRNPDAMSAALLRGESIADVLGEGPVTRRNAGLAMFLSVVFPGFGQLYNAQIIKGLILLSIAVISLLVISLSADKDSLFRNIAALFALRKGGAAPSPTMIFFTLAYLIAWLYSIVDAPFFSSKAGGETVVKSTVDKSGWEV